MENGKTLILGYDNDIVFDIMPLSGIDVNVSSSQSFQQIGETVESVSVMGITREISGVIIKNDNYIANKILDTFTPFEKGRIYISNYYCDFQVKKTPLILKNKTGKITFNVLLYFPYPFWSEITPSEYFLGELTPLFSFPVIYNSHKFGSVREVALTNIYNKGNVPKAMAIQFGSNSITKNFGLRNIKNNKFIAISETLSQGEIVEVMQIDGKLSVKFIGSEGEINIINKLAEGSTLFELEVGDNILLPYAEEGVSGMSVYIKINPAYSGIYV